MKTNIILTKIFFILTIVIVNAQNPIYPITIERHNIPDGAYLKDTNNDLDKFVGTWQYTQGNNEFTVVVQKVIQKFNSKYYEDILVAGFKSVQNGIVIADYLYFYDDLFGGNLISFNNKNRIYMFISDPERKRLSYRLFIDYTKGGLQSPSQLNWDLKITQIGWCGALPNKPVPSEEECRKDNRLPLTLTLTKVN